MTAGGWVQSYGSRCVRPPILWGDVSRPAPMTVPWTRYAQSLTAKPVKGMLTGRFGAKARFAADDFRSSIPRFAPENLEANQAVVDLVRDLAHKKETTPARIALAWVLAQGKSIVPIPGTKQWPVLRKTRARPISS